VRVGVDRGLVLARVGAILFATSLTTFFIHFFTFFGFFIDPGSSAGASRSGSG
jgi:hypothetical protein